jgi:hypothetical protein
MPSPRSASRRAARGSTSERTGAPAGERPARGVLSPAALALAPIAGATAGERPARGVRDRGL